MPAMCTVFVPHHTPFTIVLSTKRTVSLFTRCPLPSHLHIPLVLSYGRRPGILSVQKLHDMV
jgi:hypothetical protein